MKAIGYCRDWVKKFEWEHYLCSLLMKPQSRPAYWVLQAWNIELSRCRTARTIGNFNLARGKFAFWKDTIEGGNVKGNPVATALQSLIQTESIDKDRLHRIIDEKELDCSRSHFMDISELENYYGTTEGCLINLHSQMVNDQIIASQEEAAKKLGIASGFISKIVERSLQARKEGMDPGFPLELLAKHGLSPGQLITSENNNHVNSVNLEPVIKELVDVATIIIRRKIERLERFGWDLERYKLRRDGLLPLYLWFNNRLLF